MTNMDMVHLVRKNGVMVSGCGASSVRLRPALNFFARKRGREMVGIVKQLVREVA
jgi:hypothetical protein